jgi:flagellar biosynthesis chaperone FliJ
VTPREKRILRVLELRDQRLKLAVRALEEARALERLAASDFMQAAEAHQGAERARRELSLGTTRSRALIDADEWLRSRAEEEERTEHRLRQMRVQVERARGRVKDAMLKLRQLERLRDRLRAAQRLSENRTERTREDEIAQRSARNESLRRKGGP